MAVVFIRVHPWFHFLSAFTPFQLAAEDLIVSLSHRPHQMQLLGGFAQAKMVSTIQLDTDLSVERQEDQVVFRLEAHIDRD